MSTTSEMLDAVNAAITARLAGGAVQSYSLEDGRNIQYITMTELLKLRDKLNAEAAGSISDRTSYATFRGRPL
jgi:hypothetical protein